MDTLRDTQRHGGANKRRHHAQHAGNANGAAPSATRSSRTTTLVGVVVVLVLVGAVIGGVLFGSHQKSTETLGPIPVSKVTAQYPVAVDTQSGVVTAGRPDAKATIDVYEDFICPACRDFHQAYGQQMHQELTRGTLRVRYHVLDFLDKNSDPPGYSGRAANAAIAAAQGGKFVQYHDSLYSAQPPEGSAGYTNEQLEQLGRRLGLGQPFVNAVHQQTYLDAVHRDYQQARNTVGKTFYQGGFQTPTITHNGKLVSYLNERRTQFIDWLSPLIT